MNRILSGTIVAWHAGNAKKTKQIHARCADYGLKPIRKTLCAGLLYESERRMLEHKIKKILSGRRDWYQIIVLCAACAKDAGVFDMSGNDAQYEIV